MEQKQEIKRIIRLLESTAKIAEHASLTGMLKQGQKASVRQYNAILERLKKTEEIPEELFPPLEEEASFDEIGVVCKQLAAYLQEEEPTEPRPSGIPTIGNIQIKDSNLKDLGELIRDALPEWMKEKHEEKKPEEEPKESEPVEEEEDLPDLDEVESQISELGSQLQVMAERIRREALSQEEKKELADRMSQLGAKYAELAKQHAKVKLQHVESGNSE